MRQVRFKSYPKSTIDNSEYISFDVFDTLVKRNVQSPKDVFGLVELIYENRTGKKLKDFTFHRYNAELLLWKNTSKGMFSLEKIYGELEQYYESETKRIKEIELLVENTLSQINFQILPVWNFCIKNKKVILTSDMYLSSEQIGRILNKIGLSGYKTINVSGELNGSKADGYLYDLLKKKYGRLVHIGDNLRDDYVQAKIKGITSIWVRDLSESYLNKKYISSIQDNIAFSLAQNNWFKYDDYWKKIGYQVLGPLLLSMAQWLKKELKKQKINKVIFFARDGYLIKRAFEILDSMNYETDYFYVSRKSALIPNFSNAKNICEIYSRINFRQKETFASVLSRMGIEDVGIEDRSIERKAIRLGFFDKELGRYLGKILANAKYQEKCFLSYCRSVFDREKCAVVDLGWHGTIQEEIQKMCDKGGIKATLIGFYFGLEKAKKNMCAFATAKEGFNPNIIPYTRGIFETLFTAEHSSVDSYFMDEDMNVKPIFSSNDVDNATKIKIKHIQQGAVDYIKDYLDISSKLGIADMCISHKLAASGILKLACYPSYEDVQLFGKLTFNDTCTRPLVSKKPGANIFDDFINSDWRVGVLTKTFRMKLPYMKILTFLNSFRKQMKEK